MRPIAEHSSLRLSRSNTARTAIRRKTVWMKTLCLTAMRSKTPMRLFLRLIFPGNDRTSNECELLDVVIAVRSRNMMYERRMDEG